MVLNDSFLINTTFFSPSSKKVDESFNETIDEELLTEQSLLRKLLKAYEFAISCLTSQPPAAKHYQKPLIEIVALYERAVDSASCTEAATRLALGAFCKVCANVLAVFRKNPNLKSTMYRIAYGVLETVGWNREANVDIDNWLNSLLLECAVGMSIPDTNNSLTATWNSAYNADTFLEPLALTSGRFQFVKSDIFEKARKIAEDAPEQVESGFLLSLANKLENALPKEDTLRLFLWCIRQHDAFSGCNFLDDAMKSLPTAPKPNDLLQSPLSALDVKMLLVSLMVTSFSISSSGRRFETTPTICAQLPLSKLQTQCWNAVCDLARGFATPTARLRVSRIVDAVRLKGGGSEDVRVLFETWRRVLQCAASQEDNVFEAVKCIGEHYKTKMNALLVDGPSYNRVTTSLNASRGSGATRDTMLFPLACDYEFVDVHEAEHIAAIINSADALNTTDDDDLSDRSFLTASEGRLSDYVAFNTPAGRNDVGAYKSPFEPKTHMSSKSIVMTPAPAHSFGLHTPLGAAQKAFEYAMSFSSTPNATATTSQSSTSMWPNFSTPVANSAFGTPPTGATTSPFALGSVKPDQKSQGANPFLFGSKTMNFDFGGGAPSPFAVHKPAEKPKNRSPQIAPLPASTSKIGTESEGEEDENDHLEAALLDNLNRTPSKPANELHFETPHKSPHGLEFVVHTSANHQPTPRAASPTPEKSRTLSEEIDEQGRDQEVDWSQNDDDEFIEKFLQASTSMLMRFHSNKLSKAASADSVIVEAADETIEEDMGIIEQNLKTITGRLNEAISNLDETCRKMTPTPSPPRPSDAVSPSSLSSPSGTAAPASVNGTTPTLARGSLSVGSLAPTNSAAPLVVPTQAPTLDYDALEQLTGLEVSALVKLLESPEGRTALAAMGNQTFNVFGTVDGPNLFDLQQRGNLPLVTPSVKPPPPTQVGGGHDASKCLGCQDDEKQDAALELLRQLSLQWDREGDK